MKKTKISIESNIRCFQLTAITLFTLGHLCLPMNSLHHSSTMLGGACRWPGRKAFRICVFLGFCFFESHCTATHASYFSPLVSSVSSNAVPIVGLLAQIATEPPLESVLQFLGKIMMLVGVVMIFQGGWKIHRGETSDGILAIIGGFIVAMAIPIIRYFFSIA